MWRRDRERIAECELSCGRPRMVSPGVPDHPRRMQHNLAPKSRHRLREDMVVRAHSILCGLHHEYFWAPARVH
jgi:hypothetical protein